VVVRPAIRFGSGLASDVGSRLKKVSGVETVVALKSIFVEVGNAPQQVLAVDTANIAEAVELGAVTGDLRTIGPDGIAVRRTYANATHLKIGDTISVTTATSSKRLHVRAVFERSPDDAAFIVERDLGATLANDTYTDRFYVLGFSGVSAEQLLSATSNALSDNPTARASTSAEFAQSQRDSKVNGLSLVCAILGFAAFIAVLGVLEHHDCLCRRTNQRTRDVAGDWNDAPTGWVDDSLRRAYYFTRWGSHQADYRNRIRRSDRRRTEQLTRLVARNPVGERRNSGRKPLSDRRFVRCYSSTPSHENGPAHRSHGGINSTQFELPR
jgi:hypothetical protein